MNVHSYGTFSIVESINYKRLISKEANYIFNKHNGTMKTWGRTKEDDAEKFPAPTILDMEVTTICNGGCPFCYKSNSANGIYMTFGAFKKIFDKLPKSITQIAFGADYDLTSNPDLWAMMEYARNNGVIPNITAGKITEASAEKLSRLAGAVAISVYDDKDVCFDSVKRLTDRGMTQVNLHYMISEESYDNTDFVLYSIMNDPRLAKLNALVFLSLKTKGRGVTHHPLSQEKFTSLVQRCLALDIPIGFDSCSSLKFFKSLDEKQYNDYNSLIMPCESTLESSYINVEGDFYPCSFTEGTTGWEKGISVIEAKDFVRDVWNDERVEVFREKLLATKSCNEFDCRDCPIYKV